MESQEKTEKDRFGDIYDLRPNLELVKQKARQRPVKQEKKQVEQLLERITNERNQTIYLTDGKIFGFEIKVGEYLNLERYDEPIQSHRAEKIKGDWITWNGKEWHAKELEDMSYRYEISKSAKRIEKEKPIERGFEIE